MFTSKLDMWEQSREIKCTPPSLRNPEDFLSENKNISSLKVLYGTRLRDSSDQERG